MPVVSDGRSVMKQIALWSFIVAGAATQAWAASPTPDNLPAGRLPFAAKSPARAEVRETLALVDSFAPNVRVRAAAEKAVAADDKLAIAHYLEGATYFGDEAKAHLDKAAQLAANAPQSERMFVEAALLQRAHKDEEAIAAFESLKQIWPREPLVRMALAELYQASGKFDRALDAAEVAVEKAPDSARAHQILGSVLISKEQYDRAREQFQMARDHLAPKAAPGSVWFGLAQSYVYEHKTKPAVETVRAFLDAYRGAEGNTIPEVFIWNAMARIQLEGGEAKSAIATYEQGFESVKRAADLPERDKKIWEGRLHHGRGRTLAHLGKPKEAWAEAEIVKKMIDENGEAAKEFLPSYHYLAGYLKLEAGEIPAAIEELKQAQANDDPFRALLLARAYEKAGQKDEAHAQYQKVVSTTRNSLERALAYPEAKKKV
jgi:tetratricopeptide (TPR) repeat protein